MIHFENTNRFSRTYKVEFSLPYDTEMRASDQGLHKHFSSANVTQRNRH